MRKLSLTQVAKCNREINHRDWAEITMPKGEALFQIPRKFMKTSRKSVTAIIYLRWELILGQFSTPETTQNSFYESLSRQ